ncbi:metal ABC transporter solute-binding protein, Zn/Mn family [Arthrobacter sp. KK5.5]|uniref:metal ABC transporter solute-binding protein, Zn/Mn family n=1 Tax=Arthrobacter sp. KK5.5 TaxID=3373084 RepID=UPI003EE80B5F
MRPSVLLSVTALASLVLAGCATEPAEESADGTLAVVASTSVYADIARAVGGDGVEVTAIIDKTSQDPHSYEATAQDKLAISKADLVIANGGGYDQFIDVLTKDLDMDENAVVTAVDHAEGAHEGESEAGHDDHAGGDESSHSEEETPADDDGHDHAAGNEHVWYDVHTVAAVAGEIAHRLGESQPENAEDFEANAEDFVASLKPVEDRIASLAEATSGKKFAMTEPVPYYLLLEAGLEDGTPQGFSEAIEQGDDVSPALLRELRDGLADGGYAVLAYNPQTAGPQTESVRSAAESAGVPVVEFTETLPEGTDYVSWMMSNAEALAAALDG